ncbi:MAG TPA: FAD-dependent oxidoreductase [Candidatus Obscuribacter sp.]|nr:FAD-dependent oxidoreductase [Candidatus Obscuribacter sp.]
MESSQVDFVIVGGGMAALTAAYRLRHENFLLLEQYQETGGQSRGETTREGLSYSLGAAYYCDDEGATAKLVAEMGLKPQAFGGDKNDFFFRQKTYNEADKSLQNLVYQGMKDLEPIIRPVKDLDLSINDNFSQALTMDKGKFKDLLTPLSPAFRTFLDSHLKSSICGTSEDVSIISGSWLLQDLFQKSYVLPGGNPALCRALRNALSSGGHRIRTEAFVWSVRVDESGATVVYENKGQLKQVRCRHLIVATPPMVTGRILSGVANECKGPLFAFRYGSYLVANLIFDEEVFQGTYDNFRALSPECGITDVIKAETPYVKEGTYQKSMGSVLTVYRPWSPGTEGREKLAAGDRSMFAREILSGVEIQAAEGGRPLAGNWRQHLKEVILSRWGHAIIVPTPGYFQRLAALARANQSPVYSLAHSSLAGIQCLESAVIAGERAARRALSGKG